MRGNVWLAVLTLVMVFFVVVPVLLTGGAAGRARRDDDAQDSEQAPKQPHAADQWHVRRVNDGGPVRSLADSRPGDNRRAWGGTHPSS